jgi:uncharacterized protein DUF6345
MAHHKLTTPLKQCLAILLALLIFGAPLSAQNPPGRRRAPEVRTPSGLQRGKGNIRLSPSQIPLAQSPLPVLRLSAQRAPVDFVRQFLPTVAPRAKNLERLSQIPFFARYGIKAADYLSGAVDDEHLAALVNEQSGDVEVFPSLSRVKPMRGDEVERAATLARRYFSQPEIIGKDDTRAVAQRPLVLYGQNVERNAGKPTGRPNRAAYLAYVPLRRFVDRYPVYGLGSRAMLVTGSEGTLQGFVRRWKTGAVFDRVVERRSRNEVAKMILTQLEPSARNANVEVNEVELAYYDGNQDYLQPVYRFTAKISHLPSPDDSRRYERRGQQIADDFIIGYVPVGKEFEPIPSLLSPPRETPTTPDKDNRKRTFLSPSLNEVLKPTASLAHYDNRAAPGSNELNSPALQTLPDPTVGRYVVRNDDSNWVADANEFWAGLKFSLPFFTTGAPFFTNSQYYWAEPRLFTNEEQFFVDDVNVALIEVHGDWWLYSTNMNCCALVDIQNIPSPGYGSSTGGDLCYWIIHSCEVVPGPDDTASWPDPWWNIFGGVHSVVGYRTIMYIDDDVGFPYGFNLTFFAPVVSAWLNTVSSASAYSGGPRANAHGGINRPMGRASTISTCGREDDTVFNTAALPRANCLRIFWFPD